MCIGQFAVLLRLDAFLVSLSGIFRCFVGDGAHRRAFNLCPSPHHDNAHVNVAVGRIEVYKAEDAGVKTWARGP